MVEPFSLPTDFLLGSATAATQIEGGDKNNTWYQWCTSGKIKDGSSCFRANQHWERYAEDIALMKELNQQVYRMGVEWSRIEPEEGVFDKEAIEHYRQEICLLIANGIRPLITLHHFTNPLWLESQGGFQTDRVVDHFLRFTTYVVEQLGDLVSEYITINEPNVYAVQGFLYGLWPPGKNDLKLCLQVMKNLALCHLAAYKRIHEIRGKSSLGKTKVGIANHLQFFQPRTGSLLNQAGTKIVDYLFHDGLMDSMSTGKLRIPFGFGRPLGEGKFYDFIGINYYTRNLVQLKGLQITAPPDTKKNDLGWDIYPSGLSKLCAKYYQRYGAPIWITENGTCDNKDKFRAKFIYDHLLEVTQLIQKGIPVERYYHWTLIDNFEWLEGESARFGLVHLDYETQERTIKESGRFYAELCEKKAVTTQMISRYLSP